MTAVTGKQSPYDYYHSFVNERVQNGRNESNSSHNYTSKASNYAQDQDKARAKELANLIIKGIEQNPLANPFPIETNEYADLAEAETNDWVKRYKILKKEEKYNQLLLQKIMGLSRRTYPKCPFKQFVRIAELILFLYINDDKVEKKDPINLATYNIRNMEVLRNLSQPTEGVDKPLTCAVYELMRNIEKFANEHWKNRFLEAMDNHFQSTIWEAQNRKDGISIPNFKDYLPKREHTGAVYTVLPLIEIAEEIDIPNSIHEKYLKELSQMCNNIICWSNDVRSSLKEFKKNWLCNLVFVIKQEFDCSLEEAIKYSIDLHNNEVNRFESRFEELKNILYAKLEKKAKLASDESDPELKLLKQQIEAIIKYVEGMRKWMGGHFKFAEESYRYDLSQD